MSVNPAGWFEIYVQDMDRARSFYESVLDLKLDKLPNDEIEMWTFPMDASSPGASGALVKTDGVASGGNSTLIYFRCDNCAAEAARVEKSGGRLHREKMPIGEYGFVALAFDPDGNMLGLHSQQ